MNTYAIIDGGLVTNMIDAQGEWPEGVDVTNLDPRPGIGWSYDGQVFTAPPAPPADPPPPEVRRVTRLAFWQRFTQPERVSIDLSSIDDPAATQAAREQAAALRDLRTQVNSATFIDLDRADTRAGVQQLEAMGLLATGRVLEILDTAVQEAERPA